MAHLAGIDGKLGRAEEHLNALKREIDALSQAHAHEMRLEIRRDGDWHVIETRAVPPTPLRWTLIAGDAIQNMRTALDHLVWQLVLRDGHKPSRWNEFPLIDSEQRFVDEVKARKRHPHLSPLYGIARDGDAWTIIEEAQPYRRPNPRLSALFVLGRLSNLDKHRTLFTQITFPAVDQLSQVIGWNPAANLIEARISAAPLSFEKPTEIARYRFAPGTDPGVHMKGRFPVDPTFGEGQGEGSIQVPPGAIRHSLLQAVRDVVDRVRALPNVTD